MFYLSICLLCPFSVPSLSLLSLLCPLRPLAICCVVSDRLFESLNEVLVGLQVSISSLSDSLEDNMKDILKGIYYYNNNNNNNNLQLSHYTDITMVRT